MRLLNANTKQLEEFFGQIPPYAILSHTWGSRELTFKDMEQNGYTPSRKVDGCCEQALKHGLKYVWIDTCCIDKSSSAELSEAINSMWDWYRGGTACYAYLSDVPPGIDIREEDSAFSESRWFTRGWTLQELISPRAVIFYDESWNLIGRKSISEHDQEFTRLISRVTRISIQVLTNSRSLYTTSVAQKMSWAARRTTRRVEDTAYSLLGLFGLNMPLLYGEGTRAFIRLQEEILKASDDESIFAWGFRKTPEELASLFAFSPIDFAHCGGMIPSTPAGLKPSHYTLTNKGLHIETGICDFPIEGGIALARLNCSDFNERAGEKSLTLALVRSSENDMILSRYYGATPLLVSSSLFSEHKTHVYVHRSKGHKEDFFLSGLSILLFDDKATYSISEFYPPAWRRILTNFFIFYQRKNLESQHQSILFLIDNVERQNYAVWFDYRFLLNTDLLPQELKCRAAFVEKGKTLAEVIIQNKDTMEAALDWQEVLDFGDAELRFELDKGRGRDGSNWTVRIEVNEKQKLLRRI